MIGAPEEEKPLPMPHPTPFATLSPDRVLDAVESLGLVTDGRLLALNSYENRVYQVGMEEGPPVVTKFYRPERWDDATILEEHAFVAELAEADIPVVPARSLGGRVLHQFAGFRFSVYPRQGGRPPELEDPETLRWLGRFLGRIHRVGRVDRFRVRPAIDIHTYGEQPREFLLAGHWIPGELREAWTGAVDYALAQVAACFERAGPVRTLRLHGDCHAGNVLWTDAGPHFVDFDDCRTGPAVQDLWMLLSGSREDMTGQLAAVLEGYETFAEFNPAELHLVEALRTLRLIHFAGWLARRWDDPAFPSAFPWFDTPRYWQEMILHLREQIALMDEPPLAMP